MKKSILTAAALLGAILLTACGNTQGGDKLSPVGTWYEQAENADRLEITKNKLTYYSAYGNYSDETSYKLVKEKDLFRNWIPPIS